MDHSGQEKQTYNERFRTYTARKVIYGMRAGMGGASPGTAVDN